MRPVSAAVVALLLCGHALEARAHGMRTGYLELTEQAAGDVLATWKVTVPDDTVILQFPDGCTADGADSGTPSVVRSVVLHCDEGLAGRSLAVRGLGPVLTEAVVRVVLSDGRAVSHVLTPDRPTWVIPVRESWWHTATQYTRLGVWHIFSGADHLLFLLALVLYVRRPRAVLVTETAFTLSHSVSFSATALGWVHVSARAAEACIALSLILMALEAGRERDDAVAARHGPAVALVFGLVHGLGFAGGLSEIGIPDHAVATALVSFGLGVEIGQIVFLAVLLVAIAVAARSVRPPQLALAGSYLVGVTGAYWLYQRLWVCFGA